MEKLDYKKLLNHRVFYNVFGYLILVFIVFYYPISKDKFIEAMLMLAVILFYVYKIINEKNKLKRSVNFYNTVIESENVVKATDELYEIYETRSKNIIMDKIKSIWNPNFLYDDETKIYMYNNDICIVNGYFEDCQAKGNCKVQFIVMFKEYEYNMV